MNEINSLMSPHRLNRVVKLAMDSGEAQTIQEAFAVFERYRVRVRVGASVARSAALQAVLLTVVNTGRRCFLGGIAIDAANTTLDAPLLVKFAGAKTLREAAVKLGAVTYVTAMPPAPEIWIGDVGSTTPDHDVAIRATFDGWRGAAVNINSTDRLSESGDFMPAAVLAGALTVSEIFQYFRGDTVEAARRDAGLSLWRPEAEVDWRHDDGAPAHVERFPSSLWLLGLGHLGQAYLWTLGFIPYADPGAVSLVLQDVDTLEEANDSTSLLTQRTLLGQRKTRAMAAWADSRGFRTHIIEREFASNFSIGPNEPRLLISGVDNATARSQLERVGFSRVIDAGLGKGTREYLALQVHSFPSHSRPAGELWSAGGESGVDAALLSQPAYKAMADAGLDDCGLTTLAGRSVGASFVGATAAALVIAEAIRMAMGAHIYAVIDVTLRGLDWRKAISNERELGHVNIGSAPAHSATRPLLKQPTHIHEVTGGYDG